MHPSQAAAHLHADRHLLHMLLPAGRGEMRGWDSCVRSLGVPMSGLAGLPPLCLGGPSVRLSHQLQSCPSACKPSALPLRCPPRTDAVLQGMDQPHVVWPAVGRRLHHDPAERPHLLAQKGRRGVCHDDDMGEQSGVSAGGWQHAGPEHPALPLPTALEPSNPRPNPPVRCIVTASASSRRALAGVTPAATRRLSCMEYSRSSLRASWRLSPA